MGFTEDSALARRAEAYSREAVCLARDMYEVDLDWTDESVGLVEGILNCMCEEMRAGRPSERQVEHIGRLMGSYIGEVFRKNHGARWGTVTVQGRKFPGLQSDCGVDFWPWGRVQKRLWNGPEDNVWHYYIILRRETAQKADSTN